MPTYDYQCQACQHEFEVFQNMSDAPLKKCPECGGKVKRLIGTGAGLIFKGSGFYITDYKNKKSSASPASPKPKSDGGESSSSSTKSDKKD